MENNGLQNGLQKGLQLGLYCLKNCQADIYECVICSFDDKNAVNYFVDNFKGILNELKKKKDQNNYDLVLNRLDYTDIYKIGYFDQLKGEFINDKLLLAKMEKKLFIKEKECLKQNGKN